MLAIFKKDQHTRSREQNRYLEHSLKVFLTQALFENRNYKTDENSNEEDLIGRVQLNKVYYSALNKEQIISQAI